MYGIGIPFFIDSFFPSGRCQAINISRTERQPRMPRCGQAAFDLKNPPRIILQIPLVLRIDSVNLSRHNIRREQRRLEGGCQSRDRFEQRGRSNREPVVGITRGSSCIAEPTICFHELLGRIYRICIQLRTTTYRHEVVLLRKWSGSLGVHTLGLLVDIKMLINVAP